MLEFYICYLNKRIQGPIFYRRGVYNLFQLEQAMAFWQASEGIDPLRPSMYPPTRHEHNGRTEFKIIPTPATLAYLNKVSKKLSV